MDGIGMSPVTVRESGVVVRLVVWLGLALIAALPVLMIVGSFQLKSQVEPVKNGVTTTGTIRDFSTRHQLHGGTTYDPRIYFMDNQGGVHFFDGPSTSHKPTIGSTVKVSYDPNNPEHASDLSAGKATWKVLLGIGIVATSVEIYLLGWLINRRWRMRSDPAGALSSTSYEGYEA
jgi:hypothetical protein